MKAWVAMRVQVRRAAALALLAGLWSAGLAAELPSEDGLQVILRATLMDGARFDINDHHDKPVLVMVWATWCPNCLAELPALERYYRANASGKVEFLALSLDQDRSKIAAYLKNTPLSFPVAWRASPDEIDNLQRIVVTPVFYLVGKDGRVVWRKVGAITNLLK